MFDRADELYRNSKSDKFEPTNSRVEGKRYQDQSADSRCLDSQIAEGQRSMKQV